MDIKRLWPTELYFFKNENIDNNKIKEIILEKEKTESSRELSNVGGWQSHGDLIDEDCFSEIKNFLNECVLSIKEKLYRDDVKIFISQSWANVNRKGGYNTPHIHPNCHWSCAYYVTETYTSPIYFSDPRIRAQMFTSSDLLNENNKYYNNIGPEKNQPGDVLFFPSWLEHAVANNSTDSPRISISCNFQVAPDRGTYGNISRKS